MFLSRKREPTDTKLPESTKGFLEDRLRELRQRHSNRASFYRLTLYGGIVLMATCPVSYLIFRNKILSLTFFIYAILALAFATYTSPRDLELEMRQVEDELDLLSIKDASREQRAQKLLKLHQFELKRYYDQTLRQTSIIFIVGLACIFLGFLVITGSLYVVWKSPEKQLQEKLILGSLGAVGGVLSNFIAVMYLRMFSQTISSLTEFHNRLVLTHNLYFANFLVAKIKKEDMKLYDNSLADIAKSLASSKAVKPSERKQVGEQPIGGPIAARKVAQS
jgi:hypothetical protein